MTGRMKPGPVDEGFRQHASPDAIRHYLAAAKRDHAAYGRLVADLDALLTDRLAQIEAGTWPGTAVELLHGCPVEYWEDGAWLVRCGGGGDGRTCARHGQFELAARCTAEPDCSRPTDHGGRCIPRKATP